MLCTGYGIENDAGWFGEGTRFLLWKIAGYWINVSRNRWQWTATNCTKDLGGSLCNWGKYKKKKLHTFTYIYLNSIEWKKKRRQSQLFFLHHCRTSHVGIGDNKLN